jgi:peptidyl-prolyl cis-trans isomerase A (cyclophilin A)
MESTSLKYLKSGVLVLATLISAAPGTAQKPTPKVGVVIETELGRITVELEPSLAPATVANFLRYVDAKMYDGGRFHRAVRLDNQVRDDVKIEVIQGGRDPQAAKSHAGFGPIPLERTSVTGIAHVNGVISMARGNAADSAVSDFFICINDQPSLDEGGARSADKQGFGAFGRVVSGMEIVRQIQARPAPKERLDQPVRILRIFRM